MAELKNATSLAFIQELAEKETETAHESDALSLSILTDKELAAHNLTVASDVAKGCDSSQSMQAMFACGMCTAAFFTMSGGHIRCNQAAVGACAVGGPFAMAFCTPFAATMCWKLVDMYVTDPRFRNYPQTPSMAEDFCRRARFCQKIIPGNGLDMRRFCKDCERDLAVGSEKCMYSAQPLCKTVRESWFKLHCVPK